VIHLTWIDVRKQEIFPSLELGSDNKAQASLTSNALDESPRMFLIVFACFDNTNKFDIQILQYSTLQRALDIERIRELEDLIIDAIYLDILRAKLDQKEQQLEVEYTMGRDLEPGHIENVLATLNEWYGIIRKI
jgi:hypothetical protein